MTNYAKAAKRHLDDGDCLYNNGQKSFANATQLWAYGAECTIKAIALTAGYFKLINDKPDNHFAQHINQKPLGNDLLSLYNASVQGTGGATVAPVPAFEGWKIDHRYSDGLLVSAQIISHQSDANTFKEMLNNHTILGTIDETV